MGEFKRFVLEICFDFKFFKHHLKKTTGKNSMNKAVLLCSVPSLRYKYSLERESSDLLS
jgi:hypothetical protein